MRFVTLDNTRKRSRRSFLFTGQNALFFSKICDFNNLLGLKKCTGKLYSVGKISFWTLGSCSLRFIILDTAEKNGPNFLSPENSYFLKCLFLSTSKVPKKWWYLLHNNCRNTLWTLIKGCFPIFSSSIMGEKIGLKFFFIGKFAFFSQKLDFSSTSYVLKKWSYYFHSICRNTCWTFTTRPLRFATLDITRKKDAEIFYSLESLRFFFIKLWIQQPPRS